MPVPAIVVIGASAGGVEALSGLLTRLPREMPAAVLVVLHLAPTAPSVLPLILARHCRLPVAVATHGAPLATGRVYVAPPDHHLVVHGDALSLVRGPRENGHRPAADPLFRSAARTHGRRVIGVVLSGNQTDGTHGLAQVKLHGGLALVQDPAEALFDGMPRSAIDAVDVDAVLPLTELAERIAQLAAAAAAAQAAAPQVHRAPVTTPAEADMPEWRADEAGAPMPPLDDVELEGVGRVDAGQDANEALGGALAPFTCPECSGNLWEIRDGLPVRFRCRVGHSYDEPTLVAHKETMLEAALWTAVTALEENASLARQVAERAGGAGRAALSARYAHRAVTLDERARLVRGVLGDMPTHAGQGVGLGIGADLAAATTLDV